MAPPFACRHREEYILYNIPAAGLAHILPKMAALMRGWDPLADALFGVQEFMRWRQLLETDSQREAVFRCGKLRCSQLP